MLLWINLLGRIFFHAALVGCFLRTLNVQKRLLLLYKESLLRRDVFRPRLKYLLSLIRQKGESQNGCFRKAKHAKFSEKQIFLTPWYTHVRVFQEKKARQIFPKNEHFLTPFVFLKHPFWDSSFCLITHVTWGILSQLCQDLTSNKRDGMKKVWLPINAKSDL